MTRAVGLRAGLTASTAAPAQKLAGNAGTGWAALGSGNGRAAGTPASRPPTGPGGCRQRHGSEPRRSQDRELREVPATDQAIRPGSGALYQPPTHGSAGPQPGAVGAAEVTYTFQSAVEQGEQR